MHACMGISSLTTISSRQTGCEMLASVWHIRATTVICMLAFLSCAGRKRYRGRLSRRVRRLMACSHRRQLLLPGRHNTNIKSTPGLMPGAPSRAGAAHVVQLGPVAVVHVHHQVVNDAGEIGGRLANSARKTCQCGCIRGTHRLVPPVSLPRASRATFKSLVTQGLSG